MNWLKNKNREYIHISMPKDKIDSFQMFMHSSHYTIPSGLTECWKHFGRDRIRLNNNAVLLDKSVSNRNRGNRLANDCDFLKNIGRDNGNVKRRLKASFICAKEAFRKLFYCDYFDVISNCGNIWKGQKGCIQYHDLMNLEVKSMASIKSCHLYNRFMPYLDQYENNPALVEIGSGSGWQVRIIKDHCPKMKFLLVDLPTNIIYSYINLFNWFSKAIIRLPHELNSEYYDFQFITPDQIDEIEDDTFAYAIQVNGFQEMLPETIDCYFRFLRRIVKESNYFLCCNRTEKWMSKENLYIRFHEYPWLEKDEIFFLRDDEYFRKRPSCMTKVCKLQKDFL